MSIDRLYIIAVASAVGVCAVMGDLASEVAAGLQTLPAPQPAPADDPSRQWVVQAAGGQIYCHVRNGFSSAKANIQNRTYSADWMGPQATGLVHDDKGGTLTLGGDGSVYATDAGGNAQAIGPQNPGAAMLRKRVSEMVAACSNFKT